jgi:hypothetical protein
VGSDLPYERLQRASATRNARLKLDFSYGITSGSTHSYNTTTSFCYLSFAVAYWLRHYATIWKITGFRPDEVNELFCNLPNPSGHSRTWGLLSF